MNRRRTLLPFFIPLLFGFMAFLNMLGNPRVATLYGSDVVGLIAIGICLGFAFAGLVIFLRDRRSG